MVKNNVRKNTAVEQEMQTFFRRYKNPTETGTFQNARLSSAPKHFGWVFGDNITSSKCGSLRHKRRIPVNAKAPGRRRKYLS